MTNATSPVPFTLLGLDHVVLRTADLPRLQVFYQALGCTVERDAVDELGLLQLRAGRSLIDLVDAHGRLGRQGGAAPGAEGRNLDHFALRIEPFDEGAIDTFCQAHGIELQVLKEPILGAEGYGWAAYVKDPDGNRVELKGPTR